MPRFKLSTMEDGLPAGFKYFKGKKDTQESQFILVKIILASD